MLSPVSGAPNTLTASWMEPNPTNGIISGYTITCTGPSGMLEMFSFDASARNGNLEDLTPDSTYNCTISATTGAGTGSSSDPQIAVTGEDGKF